MRSSWLLELAKTLLPGSTRIIDAAIHPSWFSAMEACLDEIVGTDACMNIRETWLIFWRSLLAMHDQSDQASMEKQVKDRCAATRASLAPVPVASPLRSVEVSTAKEGELEKADKVAKTAKTEPVFKPMSFWKKKNGSSEGAVMKVFVMELQSFIERAALIGISEQPEEKRTQRQLLKPL